MKRSMKIVTAVVLIFGIAGGAVAYGKNQWDDIEKRSKHIISYVSDELELDSDQNEKLVTLTEQVMQTGKVFRSETESTQSNITALISADTFDQDQALEMLTSKTALMNQHAPDVLAALGTFLDSLSAEQKEEVLEFIQHKRGHRGWKDQH